MSHESGSVLIVVLGWVMIVSFIMLGVLTMTREQSLLLHAHRNHQQAFYLAERGLKCASSAVINHSSSHCSSLQHVTVSVDIKNNDQGEQGYQIRSEAHVGYSKVMLEAFGALNDHRVWVQNWWRIVQ